MFQRLGNRQISPSGRLYPPAWKPYGLKAEPEAAKLITFPILVYPMFSPFNHLSFFGEEYSIINTLLQAFSRSYPLIRQQITVPAPFSWTSYFGIVLPDDMLGEFSRFMFYI